MEIIKSVSDFGILIVIAGIFLWIYLDDRKQSRKANKQFEERQEKWIDKSTQINDKLADIIALNNVRIENYEKKLDEQKKGTDDSFKRLEDKIDFLQATSNELATKEMAEEIKKEVLALKKA